MISYMQCFFHAGMLREALSFITLHGNEFLADNMKYGDTEIEFTKTQLVIFHEGLYIGELMLSFQIDTRVSIPNYLQYIMFSTQSHRNNSGKIKERYKDAQTIDLVPKTSITEWDAVAFQLGTLYDDKTVSSLMLEPFCTKELTRSYPSKFYTYKQYTLSESWVDLPFERITLDILEMKNTYNSAIK